MPEHKSYWSECGQAFFTGGWGWGCTETGQDICLGTEEDINKSLEQGKITNDDLPAKQRIVLLKIIEYREEQGIGDTRAKGMERTESTGTTWHRKKNAGQFKKRQRISIH